MQRAFAKVEEMGNTATELLPALVEALQDEFMGRDERAADAIGRLGSDAVSAVPHLKRKLELDSDKASTDRRLESDGLCFPMSRFHAAAALWRVDPGQTPLAVSVILELLEPNGRYSMWSGPHAFGGVKSPEIRAKAAIELGQIGPGARDAIPLLRDAAQSEEDVLREAAVEALRRIEPPSPFTTLF